MELNKFEFRKALTTYRISKKFSNGEFSESKYSRMNRVKFFKGCLPQISLGSFLNSFSHLIPRTLLYSPVNQGVMH